MWEIGNLWKRQILPDGVPSFSVQEWNAKIDLEEAVLKRRWQEIMVSTLMCAPNNPN